jgi:hypothetical protein
LLQREEKLVARPAALKLVPVILTSAALGGCAAQGATYGDPGARALPAGQSCQSIRAELNRLDSRGVPSKVEAASRGQKLSPQSQAEADRYNELLNYYLGARCHV